MRSVFDQTVKPTEVILVVDGPIPQATAQVIQDLKNEYDNLRVFYLEENVGHGESRRMGLEKCSCDLVAIMDSDDISVVDRFEKQLECFVKDEEISVVGGYICEFEDETENTLGIRKVPLEDPEIRQYLKSRCPFNQVSVMFRKSHVENAGGFLDWYCNEDYYLWIRMSLIGCTFKNLAENLVFVRMNDDSYLRRGGLRYFRSEATLQKYMYDNGIISFTRLVLNIAIRFVVQVLMWNDLRKWIFNSLFRAGGGDRSVKEIQNWLHDRSV